MKTSLGLFPVTKTLGRETLDYLLVVCASINQYEDLETTDSNSRVPRPTNKLNKRQRHLRNSLSTLYLDAVDNHVDNQSVEIFRNNQYVYADEVLKELNYDEEEEFYPTVYFDEDSSTIKKIPDAELAPELVKELQRNYYQDIYGDSYKNKEVNIVTEDKDKDSFSETMKHTITSNVIMERSFDHNDTIQDFNSEIEVEDVLEGMRGLHELLLMKERVDLRELLVNYFNMDDKPDMVIENSKEVLEGLIEKYSDIAKEVLADYLSLRMQERIPEKYSKTLY